LWYQMLAPAKTPESVLKKLNGSIVRLIQKPDFIDQLAQQGGEPTGSTAQGAREFTQTQINLWGNLIRTAKLNVQ